MVDAFPLPRHREKSCCSRSQCSHNSPRFTYRAPRSHSATKNIVEIMRAILADLQRGAEQLQISMTMNNHDVSRRSTFSHSRNDWRKLPEMGKKTFDGWPVREAKGYVSQRSASTPFDEDKNAHGGHGFSTAAQRMSSLQSEKVHPVQF